MPSVVIHAHEVQSPLFRSPDVPAVSNVPYCKALQQSYVFNRNYSASVFDCKPDFLTIARGFGIEAVDANTDKNWAEKAFAKNGGPCLVTIQIDPEENVLPYVKAG